MKKILLITALASLSNLIIAPPSHAAEMSVKQAYQTLKHQQTTFNKNKTRIRDADANYLDHLFFVTDMALREKMTLLNYFYKHSSKKYINTYNKEVNGILASFDIATPPTRQLKEITNIIVSAIKEQQQFFNEWNASGGTPKYNQLSKNYTHHKKVQSSHKKLLHAYAILKQTYAKENTHNQQAFFDHLCALDFI